MSGVVYADNNDNGQPDAGEAGAPSVPITITWAGSDGVLGTADDLEFASTTGVDGTYQLGGLPSGPYTVLGGEKITNVDFGLFELVSLSQEIFLDLDGDGVRTPDEPLIPFAVVTLVDSDGNIVKTVITGPNGVADFGTVPPGDYVTELDPTTIPAGLRPTVNLDGVIDFDTPITLISGVEPPAPVIGVTGSSRLSVTVFADMDGDGVQQGDNAGVAGATVDLVHSGADGVLGTPDDIVFPAVVSGPSGTIDVAGLPAGDIKVTVQPNTVPGLPLPTTANGGSQTVTLAPDSTSTVLFGYRAPDLPATGGDINMNLWLGAAFIAGGAVLLGVRRTGRIGNRTS